MFKKLSIVALAFTLIMCKKSDSTTPGHVETVNPIVAKWTIVKETFNYTNGTSEVYNYPAGSYMDFKQDSTYFYYNADQTAKPNNCSGNYKVTGTKINLNGCIYSAVPGDILNETSSALKISYQDNTNNALVVYELTK